MCYSLMPGIAPTFWSHILTNRSILRYLLYDFLIFTITLYLLLPCLFTIDTPLKLSPLD